MIHFHTFITHICDNHSNQAIIELTIDSFNSCLNLLLMITSDNKANDCLSLFLMIVTEVQILLMTRFFDSGLKSLSLTLIDSLIRLNRHLSLNSLITIQTTFRNAFKESIVTSIRSEFF